MRKARALALLVCVGAGCVVAGAHLLLGVGAALIVGGAAAVAYGLLADDGRPGAGAR